MTKSPPRVVCVTGATGYVGRHLVARLLAAGHTVHALVRGASPRTRLLEALQPFALSARVLAPERLQIWSGALAGEEGISVATRAGLTVARCDAFIHCAGLTRFDTHLAEAVERQNVEATREAATLARELGIRAFHHLGTAYVQGLAPSALGADELACGQDFRNPYEASKAAAEAWLRTRRLDADESLVIYRPSIVVGGHALGAGQSVSTLYTFIKAMHFVRQLCLRDLDRGRGAFAAVGARREGARLLLPLRVAALPEACIDLISIDTLVDAVLQRLHSPHPGREVVLLPGEAHTLDALGTTMAEALEIDGLELVPQASFSARPANPLEAHFARMTRVYTPYLFGRVPFADVEHAPGPRIDVRQLVEDFLTELEVRSQQGEARPLGGLALDALGIDTPTAYFEALVDGRVGREFLRRHAYVDAGIAFELEGSPHISARLHFDHGRVRFMPAEARAIDCTYRLEAPLFMRVVRGLQDLRMAFLAGKVSITGNKELALKFGALLGGYYQHLPEHLATELTT